MSPRRIIVSPSRELISLSEISRSLGISRESAKKYVKSGEIPGGFVRWRSARKGAAERWAVWRDDFMEWLEKQSAAPPISEARHSSR